MRMRVAHLRAAVASALLAAVARAVLQGAPTAHRTFPCARAPTCTRRNANSGAGSDSKLHMLA